MCLLSIQGITPLTRVACLSMRRSPIGSLTHKISPLAWQNIKLSHEVAYKDPSTKWQARISNENHNLSKNQNKTWNQCILYLHFQGMATRFTPMLKKWTTRLNSLWKIMKSYCKLDPYLTQSNWEKVKVKVNILPLGQNVQMTHGKKVNRHSGSHRANVAAQSTN